MVWKPHVTVAAIIEVKGKFLLVEEQTSDGVKYNQPAGHLEFNESLVAAVKRETLEETAYMFEPEFVSGTYLWNKKNTQVSFLRVCFGGNIGTRNSNQALDHGILRTVWMDPDDIKNLGNKLRSPLVIASITDYVNGVRLPLDTFKYIK
jgi:8-oxo-dGTP pyrophosphatase MutT (NUDIX family)